MAEGLNSFALPPNLLDGIEQVVPQLELTCVMGATHWLVHEQPQRLNALIDEYFATN